MRKLLLAALIALPAHAEGPLTKTSLLLCLGAPADHYQDGGVEILTYHFASESRRVSVPVTIGTNTMLVTKDIQKVCNAVFTFKGDTFYEARQSPDCAQLMPRCD